MTYHCKLCAVSTGQNVVAAVNRVALKLSLTSRGIENIFNGIRIPLNTRK